MKLPDRNTIDTAENRLERLKGKIAKSRKILKPGVKFLDSKFILPPGPNLVLAHTGKGKTNLCANQVNYALKTKTGLIICVLNEETEDDFYALLLVFDFDWLY